MKSIENYLKLMLIALTTISVKVVLQVSFGTILNVERKPINALDFFNGEDMTFGYFFYYLLIYEFFYYFIFFYIWIYLVLFFLTSVYGNKLYFHILFTCGLYVLINTIFTHDKLQFSFLGMITFLGILNWWMFKKWIKFE